MPKTYGWHSPRQAGLTGKVYIYTAADGKNDVVVSEATSRVDYKPAYEDAVSLGEIGRFVRSEKKMPTPAEEEKAPAAEPVETLTPDQQEEVAEALLEEAADDATKKAGVAAAAMGDLDHTPATVGEAAAADAPDDALDLDDLIGSLEDV